MGVRRGPPAFGVASLNRLHPSGSEIAYRVDMQTPSDHSRTPPEPQPRDHDRENEDEIPDTPLDEPAPIPIQDPPPPVTPGPYISLGGTS